MPEKNKNGQEEARSVTDVSNVPKNQQDLREMVYHTDARVTAMEGQLSVIAQNQHRTDSKIDQLINHVNTPKQTNWAGWVAVGITIMISLVVGTLGLTQYITLTQEPIKQDIVYNRDKAAGFGEFQRESHYEFGRFHTVEDHVSLELERLWEHIHRLEEVDRGHDKAIAAAEISRRAIGDYLKETRERIEKFH